MKKITLLLILLSFSINAQINLEHSFTGNESVRILYQDIGGGEFKYIIIDTNQSKFHIYNLDYTPYLINVSTASSLTNGDYSIAYISKTLFDCDDSTIEYVLINNFSDFKVYRTNGDLIFNKENVIAIYCYGCNNGSTIIRPIYNTPAGTKLILTDRSNHTNYIYGLCGELPLSTNSFEENNYVTIYPVPNSQDRNLNFKINLPYQSNNKEITIYDMNMRPLDKFEFSESNVTISKNYNFSQGVYFYVLKSSGVVLQTGKFIIQ